MAEPRPVSYTTELEGVRAPLGVILYLIRRDDLDIYDIPIARITREYLDYLNMMEESQIELAGEFFVLAATLMRIKAQMLLRRDDDTDDDPREGLVRSLLEYRTMVEAAKGFREMEDERHNVFTRPVPEIDLSLYQLMKAFREAMIQFDAVEVSEIELEEYTIEEKIAVIEEKLGEHEQVTFEDLFADATSRMGLIVTLMALLELIKHGHVKTRQDTSFGTIWMYRAENFGRPLDYVDNWDAVPVEPAEVTAPLAGPTEVPIETETDATTSYTTAPEAAGEETASESANQHPSAVAGPDTETVNTENGQRTEEN